MSSPLSPKSKFGDFFLTVTGAICTPGYDVPILREHKPSFKPIIRPNAPPDLIIGTFSLFYATKLIPLGLASLYL